jgi:hypothetical protein
LISSSGATSARFALPCFFLISSARLRLVRSPIATSFVDAADGEDGAVVDGAVDEDRDVGRAPADVGDEHAELLLGIGQRRLRRGERADDELVDLDVCAGDALREVLDARRCAGHDVGLDLEAHGAHAERVLDPLLAVDDVAARQDMQHLAVRGHAHRLGRVGCAGDVLSANLALVARDRHHAAAVLAADVAAADGDEGRADLVAGEAFGLLDARGDRVNGLVDVRDHALLHPDRLGDAVADDVHVTGAAHLTDERRHLGRAGVDADEDRFPVQVASVIGRASAEPSFEPTGSGAE